MKYSDEVIHNYLWSLSDRLEITTNMFKDLIDAFFAIKKIRF